MRTFDPDGVLRALEVHEVDFVLVGGLAAAAHGSSLNTRDIDITPARDRENLDRLAAALRSIDARLRAAREPDGVEFPCDGAFLASQPLMLNLVTRYGDVDLTFRPSGFPNGYDDLAPNAVAMTLGDDVVVRVASLDDVIASKRAANRPKDAAALPYLETLADEIRSERS